MRILLRLLTTLVLLTFSSSFLFGSVEKTEKKSFDVEFGGKLFVDTDKGSININTHSSETILVEVFYKVKSNDEELAEKLINDFEISFNNDGTDLEIIAEYKGNKSWLNNIFGGSKWNKLNVKFAITVPEKYNVDLNTSGGGITVGDLMGFVEAKTSGGGLKFGNIQGDIKGNTSGGGITVGECDGNINIKTSGGGIKIDKCKGKVYAKTSGGGIKVKEVYGPIDASTSGGSIYASIMEQPREDCKLSTSGGGVTVKLAKDVGVYLDAKTSGGSVNSELPITIKGKTKRSSLQGKINEGGPQLYLRSSGGSINIEEI